MGKTGKIVALVGGMLLSAVCGAQPKKPAKAQPSKLVIKHEAFDPSIPVCVATSEGFTCKSLAEVVQFIQSRPTQLKFTDQEIPMQTLSTETR